jgi:hypothetical protein
MEQYAIVNYYGRPSDYNQVEIIHVTDNYDYANKLAFHYAKKILPSNKNYGRIECRIIKNYYHEDNPVYIHHVIVEYKIVQVEYDNECEEYEKYNIIDVWNNAWAVVKVNNNNIEQIEDIDNTLIYNI